jgi:hypothetical protein
VSFVEGKLVDAATFVDTAIHKLLLAWNEGEWTKDRSEEGSVRPEYILDALVNLACAKDELGAGLKDCRAMMQALDDADDIERSAGRVVEAAAVDIKGMVSALATKARPR